jgi:hypothetical protein
VEGWEDKMLEELDGAEHIVEYVALEPISACSMTIGLVF